MTCELEDTDFAVQLVYLVEGIESRIKLHRVATRLRGVDEDHPLTENEGHVGMVVNLIPRAKLVASYVRSRSQEEQNWPGVFEYEVTVELGAWYADNPDTNEMAFTGQLIALTDKFLTQGVPA